MKTVERSRSRKSLVLLASRAHRPPHLVHGGWRSRVRHRPDPGGGASGGGGTGTAPLVLLVDDESSIRTICRVNLETDGISVAEAVDGRQALERVKEQQPELVLLDVMRPDVDGWEVAETLAADPGTREIPIVFLSARAAREDRERARELGAVGYIVKPFDPLTLGGVVREVLARMRRGEREELNKELAERE